ncbi:hypothetical protein KY386_01130 [Candidatus Parcubacteria bacterium]|nr:hypothetical protein [Candidatus Parcubacteria bacterium]
MTEPLLAALIVTLMAVTGLAALKLMRLSFKNLMLGTGGAIVGLLLGALLSVPLSRLPTPFGDVLPVAISLMLGVVMIGVFLNQAAALTGLLPFLRPADALPTAPSPARQRAVRSRILVDTSVIIDGRIADIARAGFVPGQLLVPRFVLAELQNIADSDDAMRRGRGRRGLEMLNAIRQTSGIELEIIEDDPVEISEVDAKLVGLAKKLGTDILTTDYNLNRVAQIEGVRVLNINELSNAIRPVVLPGEEMAVKIVQAGKERGQGVGYLPDGTMIVVDNGDKLIGQEVITEVTRVFQTVAGKMIFASPKKPAQQRASSRERASERVAALKTPAGQSGPGAAALGSLGMTKAETAEKDSPDNGNGSRTHRQSPAEASGQSERPKSAVPTPPGGTVNLGSAPRTDQTSAPDKGRSDSGGRKFKAGRQNQPGRRGSNQRPPSVKSIEDSLIRHNNS